MRKFSVILPEEVHQYRRFHWRVKWDKTSRFLVKLVGLKLTPSGVQPVYLPFISVEKRPGQLYIAIQFGNWKTLELLFDRFGIHPHWIDLKKEYDERSNM